MIHINKIKFFITFISNKINKHNKGMSSDYPISSPVIIYNTTSNDPIDFQAGDGTNKNIIQNFVTTNTGDMIYQSQPPIAGDTTLSKLPIGVNGSILTTQINVPIWQPVLSTPYSITNSRITYDSVSNRFIDAGSPVYLYATKTSAQTYTTSGTTVLFNVVNNDTSNSYDPLTGIYTIPSDGYYIILANTRATSSQSTTIVITDPSIPSTIIYDQNEVGANFFNTHCHAMPLLTTGSQVKIVCTAIGINTSAVVTTGLHNFWVYKLI